MNLTNRVYCSVIVVTKAGQEVSYLIPLHCWYYEYNGL